MKLTWYGHSCFLLETAEGSVVFDPYAPGSVPGLRLPELTADLVLCSHGHSDHAAADAVRLSGKTPGFTVTKLPCFHDALGGKLRGENTIHVIEAEGLRAAHLGDLGHLLNVQQLAALGRLDLLLIPVGGHYTIGAKEAAALTEAVSARVTVPMHYRGAGFGYPVIGRVEDYTKRVENVRELDTNTLDVESAPAGVTVLRCPVLS